ncbi:LLM class F420-dependent oxidoreductase [Frankia canadensis]|uniref:LLM class F420-dependent oxidoreductase n=1 Tax=Frankia canadensis TaxID=1836972 RepID=UPI000C79631B|nr:LLM class F420-dependent oxidoreductase [Frankia canadensis]
MTEISGGPYKRPFRFNIQCSSPERVDPASWAALARQVEDLGYATLTVSDHLDEQVAPIAALMAAADATTTLRIGAMVFSNDYRHPVVLAKEAATLDALSGGRFELGLGAGWMTSDYQRAGLPLDPPGVRIARLAESLAVIKGMFAPEPLYYDGRYYQVDGLNGTPKPTQRPHPPIVIGGGGRRLLTLAAREADIIGLNMNMAGGVIDASLGPNATAAATEEKIGWIREAAGARWDELSLQVRIHLAIVTEDRHQIAEQLAAGFGLTTEQALVTPHALVGSVDQICDDLVERRERFGLSTLGVALDALTDLAPVVARLAGT